MNDQKPGKKSSIITILTWIVIVTLLYLIFWGGQFSFKNLARSKSQHQYAHFRNEEQRRQNQFVTEENNSMDSDKKIQKKKAAEIGYKDKYEKIIKKTNQTPDN
jgi:cell division protein FtsB